MFKVVLACVISTLVWAFALSCRPRARVVPAVVAVDGVERPTVLTAQDRCEFPRCGAQAYFRGLFEPKSDEQKTSAVDLCKHHFDAFEASIRATAYHVIDESYKLVS
jgi:hypothetical protein